MNVKEKLDIFKKITEKQAQTAKTELLKEIEEKLQEGVEEKITETKKECKAKVEEAKKKAEKVKISQILHARKEAAKTVADKKEEIKLQVFKRVSRELENYTNSSEYLEYLSKGIMEVMTKGEAEFFLVARDMVLADKIKEKTGVASIEESGENFIGGFKALISSKKIIIDNSFLTKLETEMESFNPFTEG